MRLPTNGSLTSTSVGAYDAVPYTKTSTSSASDHVVKKQGHVRSGWQVTVTAAGVDHVNVVFSRSQFQKRGHVEGVDGSSIDLPQVTSKEASFQLARGQSKTVHGVTVRVLSSDKRVPHEQR